MTFNFLSWASVRSVRMMQTSYYYLYTPVLSNNAQALVTIRQEAPWALQVPRSLALGTLHFQTNLKTQHDEVVPRVLSEDSAP